MEKGLIIKKILFVVIAVCFSVTVNASVELMYRFRVTDSDGNNVAGAIITATSTDTEIAVITKGRDVTDEVGIGYVYVKFVGTAGTATIVVNAEKNRAYGNRSITVIYLDDGTYRSSPSPGISPILIELGAPISPLFENNYLVNLKWWAIKED